MGDVLRVVLVLLGLGAGVLGLRRLLKAKERARRASVAPAPASTSVTEKPPFGIRKVPHSDAEADFARHNGLFGGIYEELYQASLGRRSADRTRRILKGWETRIQTTGSEALARQWSDMVKGRIGKPWIREVTDVDPEASVEMARHWATVLETWGIERDGRSQVVFSEETRECYDFEGECQDGDRSEVELACWFYQGQVIEKGLARAVSA